MVRYDRLENSIYLVEPQKVRLFDSNNKLKLECGRSLGPIDVAFETYGELNDARDNAILIIHALSGDAHVAGRHQPDDRRPGWWDCMVGPGKPIDTDKYFVICSNCLGGCSGTTGPVSINPETQKPWGLSFPVITLSDMVDLQRHLIDHLGIDKLLAVIGASVGGMQVFDWTLRYPDRMQCALAIATTARLSAQSLAFDAVGRNAILNDRHFQNGEYYGSDLTPDVGLSVARMIGHITYLSEEAMHQKFGRRLQYAKDYQYAMDKEFSVESYLDYQGSTFVDRFDANSYLYITKAMDYYDLARQFQSLEEAMNQIACNYLVISFSSDWLFTARQSHEVTSALIYNNKNVTYSNINCSYGHDSFLLEVDVQGPLISNFLAHNQMRMRKGHAYLPASPETLSRTNAPTQTTRRGSIFRGHRVDHWNIAHLIEPDSHVLDMGCGDGELLEILAREKNVRGLGFTLEAGDVNACTRRGVNVIQYDINKTLDFLKDKSYDYVVLSQALQVVRNPRKLLKDLLRIGRQVIVSFPNFAFWHGRLQLLFNGRAPVWKSLPREWYDKPEESVNYMSIKDFELFVENQLKARLVRRIPISTRSGREIQLWANLLADEAIFVISAQD